MQLLEAAISINERQHEQVLARLKRHFPNLAGVRITVLGLAFKPDTNDIRESPAIPIIEALLADEAEVRAFDPAANCEAQKLFGNEVTVCDDIEQAIANAEAIVLVTRWEEFRTLPQVLARLDPQPLFVDGRRMLDKSTIARYEGIGL